MIHSAFVPPWVDVTDQDNTVFARALAFTMNTMADRYAGDLGRDLTVTRLATARGVAGCSRCDS